MKSKWKKKKKKSGVEESGSFTQLGSRKSFSEIFIADVAFKEGTLQSYYSGIILMDGRTEGNLSISLSLSLPFRSSSKPFLRDDDVRVESDENED